MKAVRSILTVASTAVCIVWLLTCGNGSGRTGGALTVPYPAGDTLRGLLRAGLLAAGYEADSLDTILNVLHRAGGRDTACACELVTTLFDTWGIVFNPLDTTVDASLPQTVYAKKQGTCLGIALLMLLGAEKNGCPLHGVVLPGHFFVRYDDGNLRRNIEPNAAGSERADDYYRDRYRIVPDSWYHPLRNLSKREVAGVFYYELGNEARRKKKWRKAEDLYRTSLLLFPDYPDAFGNLALVFTVQNKTDSAIVLLENAARLNPGDRRAWLNRALLLLRKRRFQEVVSLAEERIRIAPHDRELPGACIRGLISARRYSEADSLIRCVRVSGDIDHAKILERLVPHRSRR